MKIIFSLICLLLFSQHSFARVTTDAEWCRRNGGTIEFDFQYNIKFDCITNDYKAVPHVKKVYNIICTPYMSSLTENKTPLFLKIVGDFENERKTIFDEYNWKMTEDELVRYI